MCFKDGGWLKIYLITYRGQQKWVVFKSGVRRGASETSLQEINL
jgi:hypothetical protein